VVSLLRRWREESGALSKEAPAVWIAAPARPWRERAKKSISHVAASEKMRKEMQRAVMPFSKEGQKISVWPRGPRKARQAGRAHRGTKSCSVMRRSVAFVWHRRPSVDGTQRCPNREKRHTNRTLALSFPVPAQNQPLFAERMEPSARSQCCRPEAPPTPTRWHPYFLYFVSLYLCGGRSRVLSSTSATTDKSCVVL